MQRKYQHWVVLGQMQCKFLDFFSKIWIPTFWYIKVETHILHLHCIGVATVLHWGGGVTILHFALELYFRRIVNATPINATLTQHEQNAAE